MKTTKSVRIMQQKETEEEVLREIVSCNLCEKDLNPNGEWNYHDREENHVCSMCNNGHWCNDHLHFIELEEPSPYNDWEHDYLRLCPACTQKYQPFLTAIDAMNKIITDATLNRRNICARLASTRYPKK